VARALTALPEEQRTCVWLCDVEGLSYADIAEVVGCPVGTVRSRIARARSRLMESLVAYAQERGIRGGRP
jgi:RNA polymerase sigma-70 factor (ECF subfamily)